MPKQRADHAERLPARGSDGRKAVAKVVNTDTLRISCFADAPPRFLQVDQMGPETLARDNEDIPLQARQGRDNSFDLLRQ